VEPHLERMANRYNQTLRGSNYNMPKWTYGVQFGKLRTRQLPRKGQEGGAKIKAAILRGELRS